MAPSAELCDDLIREILLKLPVKTLVRFKQASRNWLNMIASPNFISTHYQYSIARRRSSKNPKSFFITRFGVKDDGKLEGFITSMSLVTRDNQVPECRIHENIYLPRLAGECNINSAIFPTGLGIHCIFRRGKPVAALWNPTTREIKVLPPFPAPPCSRVYLSGFGHAEYKNDVLSYIVGLVCFTFDGCPGFKLELYSSRTNAWKQLIFEPTDGMCWDSGGVNLQGRTHLLSASLPLDAHIITFDYSSEAFGRIELPFLSQYNKPLSSLTLYDNKFLCLIVSWKKIRQGDEEEEDNVFYDMWVMHVYGVKESWRKECTTGRTNSKLELMNYLNSVGGIFLCRQDRDMKKILNLCKCKSSATTNLYVSEYQERMMIVEHVESLVSIDGVPDSSRMKNWTA